MAEEFRVLRPREYHSQLVSRGQRVDGRSLKEGREIRVETDAIRTADSSSLVKLGNTSLVCGCIAQQSTVVEKDTIDDDFRIRVELPPICSSPTGLKTHLTAQLLTRTLKSIIDDANCFEVQKVSSDDSDIRWSIDIEVICLNCDGCLLDAALIAILSALKTLKLKDHAQEHSSRAITFHNIPICTSFAVIGDQIICDPNLEEETVSQTNFSITIDSITNRCLNINKIGGKALSCEELFTCVELAKDRVAKIRQVIDYVDDEKMCCN